MPYLSFSTCHSPFSNPWPTCHPLQGQRKVSNSSFLPLLLIFGEERSKSSAAS
ncbi:hypothetical protein DAI22_07g044900 [Oryza sativa Japonica Group]|nr:hypothetical protein DAI22_07g044900 [Oryza sativa Japonica Group]